MNKFVWVIIIIVVIVAGWYMFQSSSGINVEKIATEVASGEAVLLDVRTPEELATDGYALASTHFDIVFLNAGELPDINKDVTVYTYCKSGGRAETAKKILEENGFEKVVNIGGLVDWEEAGGTVVRQ